MTTPGRLFYETHIAPMMRLQGFAREISCELKVAGDEPLPVLLSGVARCEEGDAPIRFDYTIFDARERHLYEAELRAARRKADELAAIVRSSPNAILRVDHAGRVTSWNDGAKRLFGLDPEEVLHRPVQDAVQLENSADWFDRATEISQHSVESVFEAVGPNGQELEVTVAPIREQDAGSGDTGCHSVVLRDISKRKCAERRLQILMGEMKHRVKNTLAVVSGIAMQTLPAQHRRPFIARLRTLANAQDMLIQADHEGADLRDLLDATAQEAGGADRFRYSGPSLLLKPKQVTSLSMALHELTTNALKYGALSEPGGSVDVRCEREGGKDTGPVRVVWQERDGPPVAPPARRGFGSKMIDTVIRSDLGAEVTIEYRPEGVRCEIVFDPDDT
jgi:PAS domain S-box-containing protein